MSRAVGAVVTLPLFTAAGAVMLPTVLASALAVHRSDWRGAIRIGLATVALPVPVLLLVDQATRLLELRVAAGFVLMALTYAAVVVRLGAVVRPMPAGIFTQGV
jgi:hypothetical protein